MDTPRIICGLLSTDTHSHKYKYVLRCPCTISCCASVFDSNVLVPRPYLVMRSDSIRCDAMWYVVLPWKAQWHIKFLSEGDHGLTDALFKPCRRARPRIVSHRIACWQKTWSSTWALLAYDVGFCPRTLTCINTCLGVHVLDLVTRYLLRANSFIECRRDRVSG
jgi:hypothetical protein